MIAEQVKRHENEMWNVQLEYWYHLKHLWNHWIKCFTFFKHCVVKIFLKSGLNNHYIINHMLSQPHSYMLYIWKNIKLLQWWYNDWISFHFNLLGFRICKAVRYNCDGIDWQIKKSKLVINEKQKLHQFFLIGLEFAVKDYSLRPKRWVQWDLLSQKEVLEVDCKPKRVE